MGSINIPDLAATTSRPPSRLGDDISAGDFDPFSEIPARFEPVVPAQTAPSRTEQSMTLKEDKDKYMEERRTAMEDKQRMEEEERKKSEEVRRFKEKKEAEAE